MGKIKELKTFIIYEILRICVNIYNFVSQLVEDIRLYNESELCIRYINELSDEVRSRVYQEVFVKYGEDF